MGSYNNSSNGSENEEFYQEFLTAHEARLRDLAVPQCKWKTLCRKLNFSVFDAGDNFIYLPEESSDDSSDSDQIHLHVYVNCSMGSEDSEHIYLIDHAWTYTLQNAKKILDENPQLVERMSKIMNISNAVVPSENIVKEVLNKMWLFNNCYLVQTESQATPLSCWYILDEFGSRIHFSDEPSFVIVPFFFAGDNSMYSLLFPKSNVSAGDEVTVAYPGCNTSLSDDIKAILKYPWHPVDLSARNFNLSEPPVEYFASGRLEDIFPDEECIKYKVMPEGELCVYTEYPDVAEFLTHPSFKIVDNKEDANIFWLSTREYNIKKLVENYPNFYFFSQFPSEQVLINKDLLAVISRRQESVSFISETLNSLPEWLPTTFNLKTELSEFISYFQNREKRDLDNIWITKPFNLARGLDIHITNNIAQIIRMSQIRPMVACKYITDPVLFPVEGKGLVKMDLRYIVLLRHAVPLELYVYERFWIRFANKAFALEDFDDYERHFTVMNYSDFPLQQMYCHDFIQNFENHYSSYKWCDIEKNIYKMFKDVFIRATMEKPPAGIGNFSGSRAIYGIDLMLEWDRNHDVPRIKPMILEVNWMPDCNRACQYYPEFYNDVFSVLFLGDISGKHVVKL